MTMRGALSMLSTALALQTLPDAAHALDFISTARAAILYDAPSRAAGKIAIVSAGYPLERISAVEGWIKVRDDSGKLSWLEASAQGTQRTLRIAVPIALIMEKPADDSKPKFRAAEGVMLEIIQPPSLGWVKVRHASGQEGYLRSRDAWGL